MIKKSLFALKSHWKMVIPVGMVIGGVSYLHNCKKKL